MKSANVMEYEKDRDESAPIYDATTCSSTRRDGFKSGYDEASINSQVIKRLESALKNIASTTKKQFEENPMYWGTMANGEALEALAYLNEIRESVK